MSIYKVAQACGISYSTVSRYINNRSGVSEKSARKIQEAMERLGYKPLPVDRRRGRNPASIPGIKTRNIALIWYGGDPGNPDLDGSLRTNGRKIQQFVSRELTRLGLHMMVDYVTADHPESPLMQENIIDGALVVGSRPFRRPFLKQLESYPHIWLVPDARPIGSWVGVDDALLGRQACQYLFKQGHRNQAFVSLRKPNYIFDTRQQAFHDEAVKLGCSAAIVCENNQAFKNVQDLTATQAAQYIVQLSPKPTGLFVSIDADIPQLYSALTQQGLTPGKDLQIISCDHDQIFLDLVHPKPATFELNFDQIASKALEQLLQQLVNHDYSQQRKLLVKPTLIESP